MVSACPVCTGIITWTPAYHEWHGSCSDCHGCFLWADPTVEDRDKAVCLLPHRVEWIRLVRADGGVRCL